MSSDTPPPTPPSAPTQPPTTPPSPSPSVGRKWLRRAGKPGKLLAHIADWSEDPPSATRGYSRVIRACRNAGGAAGFLLWVAVVIPLGASLVRASSADPTRANVKWWLFVVVVLPLALTLMGMLAGVAGACLFAPEAYIQSPGAAHWRERIGTQSTTTARVACAFALLVFLALFALVIFFALTVANAR